MSNQLNDLYSRTLVELQGVGKKTSERLAKLGLKTVADLLLHMPFRYEDRSVISKIKNAIPESMVTLLCTVTQVKFSGGKRSALNVTVKDDSGVVSLVFFGAPPHIAKTLTPGVHVRVYGQFKTDPYGPKIVHPTIKILRTLSMQEAKEPYLTPIYRVTEGVRSETIHGLIVQSLDLLMSTGADTLPMTTDMSIQQALRRVHLPPNHEDIEALNTFEHPAQQALIKDELLAYCATLLLRKQNAMREFMEPLAPAGALRKSFIDTLPYQPTNAQIRVVAEIDGSMSEPHPMMRLVQGDVGAGKTLVAALAATRVLECGMQVVLLAPTEILAEQHASGFDEWFAPLGVKVAYLSGRAKASERKKILSGLLSGEISLLVGTHAVFQKDVQYARLGLIIIDEQHRFGVKQRLALREKAGGSVHQLVMTATPIPRTLAMVAFADLDISIIDELPPGRTPVKTVAMPNTRRDELIRRIRDVCATEKRQVYWVCTLIDETDSGQRQAAVSAYETLCSELPTLRVGLVHGRMNFDERQETMLSFKRGDIDVLVATTVIEVGVNVPNASLMVIENPERLGLAQLHQLRGRVGRGSISSSCILMYHTPLTQDGLARLQVLRETNDGFVVAQKDLELRGHGHLLGVEQTGETVLQIADLSRDHLLLGPVQSVARTLLLQSPDRIQPLAERWGLMSHEYAKV